MSFRFVRFALIAAAATWAPLARAADSNSWPSFRGPDRTAISPDTGLLKQWPAGGPKLLWEAPGAGGGYASLAITGGKIYTLGDGPSTIDDQEEFLMCFDAADGKQLWLTKAGPAWTKNYEGSRSTPTVDGNRVYVVTPHGVLLCCESASGKELWRKDFTKDFGGRKGDGWGYSESVLVDGNKVICTPGGAKATMVALNKENGETIWKSDRPGNRGAGHASPVISTVGRTRVYVQSTASGPMGVRADDGKLLWTYDIDRTTAVIPTPVIRGDLVFFTAGYGRGGALLRQVPADGGEVSIDEVYPLKPELNNRHGGAVLIGDYIYADSDHSGVPFCAELMTGEIKWKERGPGRQSAAIAAADGCLYIRFADGTMALVEASPEKLKVLSTFKIPGSGPHPSWSHPVIVGGRLYLREWDKILCYDLRD
jgi:outer membrane protein assembly factor BamB